MNLNAATDKELVKSTLSGSKEAFGILYDRYFDYAMQVSQGQVGRIGTAKDLVQESFLQAYLCLKHLKNPDVFKSWLHGIVLNICKAYIRDKNTSLISIEYITGGCIIDVLLPAAQLLDPCEIAEHTELRQIVLRAVNNLSPNLRRPILLFYFEHLSLREIAWKIGVSNSAVKSRLHRGRLFLREILYRLIIEYSYENYFETWRKKMIKVRVFDVVKMEAESSKTHAVLLIDDKQSKLTLICIGKIEAAAIALGIKKREFPRPMTYELIANLMEAADVKIVEVQVESLRESTFYAVIKIRTGKKERDVDARPSDAIALALRTESPIYVSEEVMDRVGITVSKKDLKGKTRLAGIKDMMDTIDEKLKAMPIMMSAELQAENITIKSLISDD